MSFRHISLFYHYSSIAVNRKQRTVVPPAHIRFLAGIYFTFVDVLYFNTINNKELKEHIQKNGKILFMKDV